MKRSSDDVTYLLQCFLSARPVKKMRDEMRIVCTKHI